MKLGVILVICVSLSGPGRSAQTYRFEPTNSFIQIHLGTAGLLRTAGHEHLIQAPLQQGTFVLDPRALSQSSVEVLVDARRLKVIDRELSAQDREKVQTTMESARVLDVRQFPTIAFRSISIESSTQNQLVVRGLLTIRGKTNLVMVQVTLNQQTPELKATGTSRFKQTQFGIKPVTAGLGTVRVRDLISIEFTVQGHPTSSR